MNANELRIGNLFDLPVRCKNEVAEYLEKQLDTEYFPVCAIEKDQLRLFIDEELEFYYSDLIPIPLTEEWLLKFGFIWSESHGLWILKSSGSFNLCENSGYYKLSFYNNLIGEQFNSVHQLQNLYFALTEKELEINN